jgi:hypothetical protein
MYAVKSSPQALIIALAPLAAVHAVLLAMTLLKTQTTPALMPLPTPDRVLFIYVVQLAIDAALLFTGHLVLQGRAVSGRIAYALMGGIMAAASYAIAWRNGLQLTAPDRGTEITGGVLPTFAGMIAGFLYSQFAGLAPAAKWPKFSDEALHASQIFDGPIRVRTSIAAVAIAALVPAALTTILSLAFFAWLLRLLPSDLMPEPGAGAIYLAALPAQIFLTALIATVIPSAILIICTHHIARVLHRSRGYEYAALGSLVAVFCSLLFAPVSPFRSLTFLLALAAINGAIMGALYRRFAGLEPVPLPEPVIVTDESTLVGADHSSRQHRGVVFSD